MEIDVLILEIAKWAVPTLLGAAVGALSARLHAIKQRDKALEDGVRVLLMARIQQDYEHYIVLDERMTVNDKELHLQTFQAYEALEGNGIAKGMHEEIMAKKPWIVTD